MKLEISEKKFKSLKGLELIQEILQDPINQVIGKNVEIKRKVFGRLSSCQKILFSLLMMLSHTKAGWLEFYHGALFRGGYEQAFPYLKEGLKQIGDPEMLIIVNKAIKLYVENQELLRFEGFFNKKKIELSMEKQITFKTFKEDLSTIDHTYFPMREKTIQKLESYVRANPNEFFIFTNSEGKF